MFSSATRQQRSRLEEHADRKSRQRQIEAEIAAMEAGQPAQAWPEPKVKPDKAENSRLKLEAAQLRKQIAEKEAEKAKGAGKAKAGDAERKNALAKQMAEQDKFQQESLRLQKIQTLRLEQISSGTEKEGEKSRKLSRDHHKDVMGHADKVMVEGKKSARVLRKEEDARHKEAIKHQKEHTEELKKSKKVGLFGGLVKILFTALKLYALYKLGRGTVSKLTTFSPLVHRLLNQEPVKRLRGKIGKYVDENTSDETKHAARKASVLAKRKARQAYSKLPKRVKKHFGGDNLSKVVRQTLPSEGSILPAVAEMVLPSSVLTGISVAKNVAAPLAAAGYAGYQGFQNAGKVFDGTQSTGDRIQAGAHLAVSGAGATIGGVLGGAKGAAYGAAAGNLVADGAQKVGEAISGTRVGDAIGEGTARVLAMLGSSEAADAVKSMDKARIAINTDEKTLGAARQKADEDNLAAKKKADAEHVVALTGAVAPIAESTRTFADKIKDWTDTAGRAAGSVWGGIKSAASTVVEGYKKDGVMGAAKALPAAGKALSSGATDAVEGVKYDMKKGTASQVDLAMGFTGKSTIKGLNDSQTRALAGNTMATESGGKLGIENQYGYAGQYQMGADALVDNGVMNGDKLKAAKAASKAAGRDWYKDGDHKAFMGDDKNYLAPGGKAGFLGNKQLQDDTFVKYTNKNIDAGMKSGALTGVSTPEEIAAYAKAAHLKGSGGANNLMLRGLDSADANGTKTSTYADQAAKAMTGLAAKVDAAKAADATKVAAVSPVDAKLIGTTPSTAKSPETKAIAGGLPVTTTVQGTEVIPMPTVAATPQPAQLLAPGTPTEAQSVRESRQAQTAPAAPRAATVTSTPSQNVQSGAPTLDEMPIMLSDFGLILLQVGHV